MKIGLIVVAVFGFGIVLFLVVWNRVSLQNNSSSNSSVRWEFDPNNKVWKVNSAPPVCPEPLVIDPPVDVNLASSILYPGQFRGGDYKPHGGFRFDKSPTNAITVVAPMDGNLYMGSRHLASGEVQYVLYFTNPCGISYKLDHLLTLTPKFQQIIEKIPMGGEGDSRASSIEPNIFIKKGEIIATEVGFRDFQGSRNVFFDFGVYDLRTTNEASKNPSYASKHKGYEEFGFTALCWLDYLSEPSKTIARSLPGADGQSGKRSDYCN